MMSESGTFLGRPVRSLQTMLRVISRAIPEIPPVIPDGVYGQSTMRAVTALQRYADLPVTGVVDQATWDEVVSMYYDACEQMAPAQCLAPGMAPGQCIVPGEENLHMYLVEAMFKALGRVYENVPEVVINGVNDAQCVCAIKWLQAMSGLPETGEVDRRTWRCLAGLYRLSCGNGGIDHC